MVGVVSSIPSGDNLIFADFETPRCQFCTEMPEMSHLYYLRKTRLCFGPNVSLNHKVIFKMDKTRPFQNIFVPFWRNICQLKTTAKD